MNRKLKRAWAAVKGQKTDPKKMESEYYTLCARAGEIQYRLIVAQEELKAVNQELKELNQSYHKYRQSQVEESKNAPVQTAANQAAPKAS